MKSSDSALLQALLDAARGIGIRGGYKPGGTSGAAIRHIIRQIQPSLYPLSAARDQLDLDALAYSLERLPEGREEPTWPPNKPRGAGPAKKARGAGPAGTPVPWSYH